VKTVAIYGLNTEGNDLVVDKSKEIPSRCRKGITTFIRVGEYEMYVRDSRANDPIELRNRPAIVSPRQTRTD